MGTPVVKVLTGQRRVGKSFLLRQLIAEATQAPEPPDILYINKELYQFDTIRTYHDLVSWVELHFQPGRPTLLAIDEVQEIDGFEKAIRHMLLQPGLDICITGSNANLLSGELATLLGGRYVECRVYSLSFAEFLTFHQMEAGGAALEKYLLWGGLPFLMHLPNNDAVVMDYLQNVGQAILLKDVVQRNNLRQTAFLTNLVRYLAANTGNIISAKSISDYLRSQRTVISPQVVLNYLDHLQAAMLVFKARRKDLTGRKIFEIHEKYYFEDWGLMNAQVGFANRDIGKILENVVFIHLKIQGYDVFVGSAEGWEIDFIAEKDGLKKYLQVCYQLSSAEVIDREYRGLQKIDDNYPKYVVSLDAFAQPNVNGIRHLHLLDFLLEKE